jgi:hypothetical protein
MNMVVLNPLHGIGCILCTRQVVRLGLCGVLSHDFTESILVPDIPRLLGIEHV